MTGRLAEEPNFQGNPQVFARIQTLQTCNGFCLFCFLFIICCYGSKCKLRSREASMLLDSFQPLCLT